MNMAYMKENGKWLIGFLMLLAGLPACTGVNTFPTIARAGGTVSVMVGGSEKARKETIDVTLTDASNQTWDLKSMGLVRSVFNLRTDGRANGMHYSPYLDSNISWLLGHEPLQTVLVADIPAGAAAGMASLTISLNATDNSSGVADPFAVNLEIMPGTGSSDQFLLQDLSGPGAIVDFSRLEAAPYAKINFGAGATEIGAASLVVDFNETVLAPGDINVYTPEAVMRDTNVTPVAFGKYQRMVYWRQDGQRLYVDIVAPQGIMPRYLQVFVIHPRGLTASPNFQITSASVYDVSGNLLSIQPGLTYFP